MNLEIKWYHPVPLVNGSKDLIFKIDNIEDIYTGSGVYMFCRIFDSVVKPIYIGKSRTIQKRIQSHINSVKMMNGIKNSPRGKKVLIVGELIKKKGQPEDKAIGIIETALIEHALLSGHELLNEQGTKRPTHKIAFSGYNLAKRFSGQEQTVKAKKTIA